MQCHSLPLLDAIFRLMSMRSSIFSDINQIHEISLARYNHPHTIAHHNLFYISIIQPCCRCPASQPCFQPDNIFLCDIDIWATSYTLSICRTPKLLISQNTMPWLLCKPPNCKLSDHFSLSFIYISCFQLHFTISPCTLYIHNRVVSNHISMHVSNGIKSKCL